MDYISFCFIIYSKFSISPLDTFLEIFVNNKHNFFLDPKYVGVW